MSAHSYLETQPVTLVLATLRGGTTICPICQVTTPRLRAAEQSVRVTQLQKSGFISGLEQDYLWTTVLNKATGGIVFASLKTVGTGKMSATATVPPWLSGR